MRRMHIKTMMEVNLIIDADEEVDVGDIINNLAIEVVGSEDRNLVEWEVVDYNLVKIADYEVTDSR